MNAMLVNARVCSKNIRKVMKLYLKFCPLILTFCCDAAYSESRKILITGYKLENYISPRSWEGAELAKLTYILVKKPPVFAVAGLFELNRKTILRLVNTIATYFIVIAQFKN
ncbi:hypothetical protein NQ317_016420 [Molorchus minor]|uniref:Odorant receptor n=1 Tax=Molorchus minor TaxID=1323400 RepID=A0ABQ9K006_9CUCU|nr:hypothetical protein NQ317_016420 [Molorchus minor]